MKEKFDLEFPFQAAGQTYSAINFRKPKVRDLRNSANSGASEADRTFQMVINLTELPGEVIDEMDPRDYIRLGQLITSFIMPSPKT